MTPEIEERFHAPAKANMPTPPSPVQVRFGLLDVPVALLLGDDL